MKKYILVIGYNAAFLLLVFGAGECYLNSRLNRPASLAGPLKTAAQSYYMAYDRKIIQFESEMAQYDSELFYRLKPGEFQFENREFKVEFRVNSLGVRDDEASLDGPEVIVLGDSQAMGWAVPQNETFAELIEAKTGRKTLNAAVSSYGTAREFALLKQVDTSRTRVLIVQYCQNDYQENEDFFDSGELNISPREKYVQAREDYLRKTRYYPFKHVIHFPFLFLRALEGRSDREIQPDEARVFLNVIERSGVYEKVESIPVVPINGRRTNKDFITALKEELRDPRWNPLLKARIRPVDLSAELTEEYYNVLDDHLNEQGHELVAEALIRTMGAGAGD